MTLIEGNSAGAVRVVIFEDLQCGDCLRFRGMMDSELLPRFGERVAFEHRDFPLPKHSWARAAAEAARHFAAHSPALGLAFRRATLECLKQISPETLPEHIHAFAAAHGLDPKTALSANPAIAADVEADYRMGVARGVAKTPTVFVGETPFIEVFTLEEISDAINEAGKW